MSDPAGLASSDEEGLPNGGDATRGRQRIQRDYSDGRLERVAAYTTTTMRLKPDKWTKMMATDEMRRIVLDWLLGHTRVLVVTLSPGGDLVPRSGLSDLYLPFTVPSTRAAVPSDTLQLEDDAMASATAAVSAVVSATPGALLVPLPPASSSFTTLDGVPRGKCAYFVRRNSSGGPLTAGNFSEEVLYGDFPVHSKIETMSLLFDEVLQPLLEQAQNQWPAVVRKDLQARIKEVRNTLTEIKGKTNNRTILSLLVSPTIVEEVFAHVSQCHLRPAQDPKFRNLLEEMFINWTTQMHDIVVERSECQALGSTSPISQSAHPAKHITFVSLPAQEIAFWTNRKLNLQNIYEQLREPTHKILSQILERIESVYHRPYANAFRQLVAAWLEAQDVSLWLQPLLRQTSAFNSVQFCNGHDLVTPLVHVLHLVWSNATYYRSTQRMSVLLRCICNMMVHRASEDLEFPLLFQGDADEGLIKINRTIEVLELFKQRILDYKERYAGHQVLLPALPGGAAAAASSPPPDDLSQLWRFCHEDVFGQTLEGFSAQLLELRQVFEAAVQFQQLEKLEVGGLRGKLLTDRVREIFAEFKVLFEQWSNVDIDLTATQASKWRCFRREQTLFFGRMQLLEQKLATVLLQAFEQCHSWTHLLRLTLMFGGLLYRSAVQPELAPVLPHILKIYDLELEQLETSVTEVLLGYEIRGLVALPMANNFPLIAGAMTWLEQHISRCDELGAKELNHLIDQLLQEKSELQTLPLMWDSLLSRRNILTTKLSNLQMKIWTNWLEGIEKQIVQGLDESVLSQPEDKSQLHLNFSLVLFTLLKETKYLLALQATGSLSGDLFQLPEPLLELYDQRDAYWERRIRLIKIGEFYNGIRSGECAAAELQLIPNELAAIDEQVGVACQKLTWREYDDLLVAGIFEQSRDLFARLHQSHGNLDAILASMRRWSREPLHQRSLYGRNLLDLRHQQDRVRLRLLQCDETKMLLNRLLIANFCLFFNYESQEFQLYSRDLSVQEFVREFPKEQRQQYNKYLASVDELICREVRQAMRIRFQNNFK